MQITAQQLTKTIGGNEIFTNLSFEINEKERIAIVGRNGSGKTTLFQLLAGLEEPDAGTIIRTKNTQIGYLHQIPDYPGYSVYEVLNESFSELHGMQKRL